MPEAVEKIRTMCPHCGQKMRIKRKYLAKRIPCPACATPFMVDELESPEGGTRQFEAIGNVPDDDPAPMPSVVEDDEAIDDAPPPEPVDEPADDIADDAVVSADEPPLDEPPLEDDDDLPPPADEPLDDDDDLPPPADEPLDEPEELDEPAPLGGDTDAGLPAVSDDDMVESPANLPTSLPNTDDDRDLPPVREHLSPVSDDLLSPPASVVAERKAAQRTSPRDRRGGGGVKPSAHFDGMVSPGETAIAEYDLGRSGLLVPERSRALITDRSVLIKRQRRYLLGLLPGPDEWFIEYPLDAPDLRKIRVHRPSGSRMMLVVLVFCALSAGLWATMAYQWQPAMQAVPFIATAAHSFDQNDVATWWWSALPGLLAILWYGVRFRARLETDGFSLGVGRGKASAGQVREFVHALVEHRIAAQERQR
ncbi:MAG: hypothetical protein AB7K09_20795 [Planctomycetota bacterium]